MQKNLKINTHRMQKSIWSHFCAERTHVTLHNHTLNDEMNKQQCFALKTRLNEQMNNAN